MKAFASLRERALRLAHTLRGEGGAFLSWWLHELRDIGESMLARVAPTLVRPLVVHLDAGVLTTGAEREPLQDVENLRGTRAIAVLENRDALVHELPLPAAVERDIDRVIDLHLERELPLPRDLVCVDWHITQRDRVHKRIVVRLLVAHREKVDRLRDGVIESGLRPVRVACLGPSGELLGNLQPRQRRAARLRLTPLDKRLAAVAATLTVVALGMTGGQWIYERIHVERETARVRALAESADSLARQLRNESAGAAALASLMRAPDAVDVLTGLTASSPTDTWAFELEVKPAQAGGYQLKLGGFAPAATTFVDTLEKTPQFEQVRLVSATSAGLGSGRDRLQLTAKWARQ